jgi:D-inositol-3-phosphate glycosyltransferase
VWVPTKRHHGWEIEGAQPYETRWIGGGLRSLYELSVALASSGLDVELRGVVHMPTLNELADAAGARPHLPTSSRRLAESDTVIFPEGIDDPTIHARLALSPARTILMLLGPPGLIGWPFAAGWSRPDPLTVDIEAVARPEHFCGAAALGYELWTVSPGLRAAAREAGVECRLVGTGWPGGVPERPLQKDLDVVTMRDNRWAPLAAPVVRRLREDGVECVQVPAADHARTLEALARARILLLPSRVEGQSRLGCEARAMGAVPVVLNTNPYAVGLDEAGGAVALPSPDEMPRAICDLLADRDRLGGLRETARASARSQVAWAPYVARVAAALDSPAAASGRGARSEVGATLERSEKARARCRHTDSQRPTDAVARLERAQATVTDALADAHDELARHKQWLQAVNESLSWRITAPIRSGTAAKLVAPLARLASRRRRVTTEARRQSGPRAGFFGRPTGRIDGPVGGSSLPRLPVRVFGWCLFPGTSVTRVEVIVDGALPRRARLGIDRQDVAAVAAHCDAPISGFELQVDLGELPLERDSVTVHAVAYAADGRRLSLERVTLALEPHASDRWATRTPHQPDFARAPRAVRSASRPLRLVAFSHELSYSGASLYLSELLFRLLPTGEFEFSVVSFDDGPLRAKLAAGGIPVHLTSAPPLVSPTSYEHRQGELEAWLGPQRFDAALVNTLGAFPGADAAVGLGIPTVWSIHESLDPRHFWAAAFPPGTAHPHVQARVEKVLAEVAALVFPARATQQLFTGYAEADKLVTVPYGIERTDIDAARRLNRPRELRRRLGIPADARVVLCLGSIEPRKSQAMLAQAFAQVAAAHPAAQLLLVGKTDSERRGGYARGLEEYLIRSGLESRVRIEPVTDDPYLFQSLADVVVCSSDLEALPRSVVEAMAFEKPVLSTAVYGIPELIDDGVTGFLCDASDVAALARGLERVLGADDGELRAVGSAASARVRSRHDPDRQAAAFAAVLEAAVAQSPGSRGLTLAAP